MNYCYKQLSVEIKSFEICAFLDIGLVINTKNLCHYLWNRAAVRVLEFFPHLYNRFIPYFCPPIIKDIK